MADAAAQKAIEVRQASLSRHIQVPVKSKFHGVRRRVRVGVLYVQYVREALMLLQKMQVDEADGLIQLPVLLACVYHFCTSWHSCMLIKLRSSRARPAVWKHYLTCQAAVAAATTGASLKAMKTSTRCGAVMPLTLTQARSACSLAGSRGGVLGSLRYKSSRLYYFRFSDQCIRLLRASRARMKGC